MGILTSDAKRFASVVLPEPAQPMISIRLPNLDTGISVDSLIQ